MSPLSTLILVSDSPTCFFFTQEADDVATNNEDTRQQTMDKYNGLQPGEQHEPPLPAFLTYQAGATLPSAMWQITDKQLWYVLTFYVQEYEETLVMDDDSDMLIDLYHLITMFVNQ